MADQAMKKDAGKDRWDLLPLDVIEGMVKVLTFGANKYADNGWKGLMENDPEAVARVTASFRRHQLAIEKHGLTALDLNEDGETDEDHSGLPHIDHVMCNVLFLKYRQMLLAKQDSWTIDIPPTCVDGGNCPGCFHCLPQGPFIGFDQGGG